MTIMVYDLVPVKLVTVLTNIGTVKGMNKETFQIYRQVFKGKNMEIKIPSIW